MGLLLGRGSMATGKRQHRSHACNTWDDVAGVTHPCCQAPRCPRPSASLKHGSASRGSLRSMRPSAKSGLRQRRGPGGPDEGMEQPGMRTPSESREADVEAEGVPSPIGGEVQSSLAAGGRPGGRCTLWEPASRRLADQGGCDRAAAPPPPAAAHASRRRDPCFLFALCAALMLLQARRCTKQLWQAMLLMSWSSRRLRRPRSRLKRLRRRSRRTRRRQAQ